MQKRIIMIDKNKFRLKMEELIEEFEGSDRFPNIDREILRAQYDDIMLNLNKQTLFEVAKITINNQTYSNLHGKNNGEKDDEAMKELVRTIVQNNIKLTELISMDLGQFKERDTDLSPVILREVVQVKILYTGILEKEEKTLKLYDKMDNVINVLILKSSEEKFAFLNFIKKSVQRKNEQRIDSEELDLNECIKLVFEGGRSALRPLLRRSIKEIAAFVDSKKKKGKQDDLEEI